MKVEDLKKVLKSLQELSIDVSDFSWGPSMSLANERKREAISIIENEIKRRSITKEQSEYNLFRAGRLFDICQTLRYLIANPNRNNTNKELMLENSILKYYTKADEYDKQQLDYMYSSNFHLGSHKEQKELLEFFLNLIDRKSLEQNK